MDYNSRMTGRLEQLTKLHAADPVDADVAYMIAMEHTKAGNTPRAVEWFDKSLQLDPHYLYAYYHKARALFDAGDADDAQAVLSAGITVARGSNAPDAGKAIDEMTQLLETIG